MADDFEKSHGKPRPTLLRRTDVQPHIPRTAHERLQGRASDGTATSGNQLALGRGWKSTIRKTIAGAVKALGAQ
ncbi:MAG: hypothetical protein M3O50_08460 [Myxococcota bacterium]|nr:hypothetical protein [Myxococcota bacterium]